MYSKTFYAFETADSTFNRKLSGKSQNDYAKVC